MQIAKRHRDVHYIDNDQELAPLSIIITTLASRAHETRVSNFECDHEFNLTADVLRRMPQMLQTSVIEGGVAWCLWNQTTADENFCEKWNQYPDRANAFFQWHGKVVADIERLAGARVRTNTFFGDGR